MELAGFCGEGLRFTCVRCSGCCRHESGFVFLSRKDAAALAETLGVSLDEFIAAYCRWAPGERGRKRLSLKEKPNFDCVFWDGGCAVYEARPLQCRAFPFWPRNLASRRAWDSVAAYCPGAGKGTLHPRPEIERLLAEQAKAAIIEKEGLDARPLLGRQGGAARAADAVAGKEQTLRRP
jgi:Fe-S-cluster containining protein